LTFAREGADLILLARTPSEVNEVAKECDALGVQALPLQTDVGRHEEVNRAVELGLERFSKIDILVSVAGMRPKKPFWEVSDEEWGRVFAVNLHSTFYLAKALVPQMLSRKRGSIIALGGRTSLISHENSAAIAASKHGLYGLIKSLALDLGPHGIRANLLALSHVETSRPNPEWYPETGGDPNTNAELERIPLRRWAKVQEVANAALFLASDASSYITGDRIVCAGGGL